MNQRQLATLLSVLGVVLTGASVVASIAQYRAADLQAQAAIVALMPQLEIRSLLDKRDSEIYTDRRLEITSDGGPVYNFSSDRLTWIEFQRNRVSAFDQPLIGYFAATMTTGRIKGEIQTIVGYRNHEKLTSLERKVGPSIPKDVFISGPVSILRLAYRDSLKREVTEFFKVDGGTVLRLSAEVGEALWTKMKANEAAVGVVDLDRLGGDPELTEWLAKLRSRLGPSR